MQQLRTLQQTQLAKIEHDLVLSRIGELAYRDIEILTRMQFFKKASVDAGYFEGLHASSSAGLTVDLSAPALVIQKAGANDAKPVVDLGPLSITLNAADATNTRIDTVQGQVQRRSVKNDPQVMIVVDPLTKTIGPAARDREYEYFLAIGKVTGTPSVSPVPPAPTAATAGILTGSVAITGNKNLASKYLIELANGLDGEFHTINLQGATPSATTPAEILAKINAVFPGMASYDGSNFLVLTGTGTGEASVVQIRQPFNDINDTYALLLGGTESVGYRNVFQGSNGWFKIAEIVVPANATTLIGANIRSIENKDTDWATLASSIVLLKNFQEHRDSSPMDHAAGSVKDYHLDPTILTNFNVLKTTNFRGPNAPVYLFTGDTTNKRGRIFLSNMAITNADGSALAALSDIEQLHPLSRVDQRIEDISGSGYNVPISLIESLSHQIQFIPGDAVAIGSNNYTAQYFATGHKRVGVYVNSVGTGYTHLRLTLHDILNNEIGHGDIPIASLVTGWNYVNITGTIILGQTYHYHAYLIGAVAPTAPVLATSIGTQISFREMYGPTAGKYTGPNTADVLNLIDKASANLFTQRGATDDNIVNPGDGFAGKSTGTNFDIMLCDFSDATFFQNWAYEDYIGFDPVLGLIKFPPGATDIRFYFAEFNVKIAWVNSTAKNILRHKKPQRSIDDEIEAIIESVVTGKTNDFTLQHTIGSGSLFYPQYLYITETGTPYRYRLVFTWGTGDTYGNPTSIAYQKSIDSGATYKTMRTETLNYSGGVFTDNSWS